MDILKDFDNLNRYERNAFIAWFGGGSNHVLKFKGIDHVSFGKAECEWVDFTDFWLTKLPNLEWITVKEVGRYVAKGRAGRQEVIEYDLWPTSKGTAIREAYWDRVKKRFDDATVSEAIDRNA